MNVANVSFSFKTLQSTQDLHRYSLEAVLSLDQPPAQQFRLKILWPTQMRLSQLKGLVEGEQQAIEFKNARFTYKELWLYSRESIFPGQTVKIIGPGVEAELDYEFDHQTYDILSKFNVPLRYTLYLESHMPVEKEVSFRELQRF